MRFDHREAGKLGGPRKQDSALQQRDEQEAVRYILVGNSPLKILR